MRALAVAVLMLVAAGCAFTFDDSEPDVPLRGAPLALDDRPAVFRRAGEELRVLPGDDGAPWAALYQILDIGAAIVDLHLVRLAEPQRDQRFDADRVWLGRRAIYALDVPPSDGPDADRPATLRVFHAGAAEPLLTVGFPQRNAVAAILPFADDRAFGVIPGDGGLSGAMVHVASGRALPVPDGTALFANGAWVDSRAERLYLLEDDRIIAHGLAAAEPDRVVATRPFAGQLTFQPDEERLIACGAGGLAVVERGATRPLALACATVFAASPDGWIWFRPTLDGPVAGVPLDGSAPARAVSADAARLLTARGGVAVTSTTPIDAYRGRAGDGWIGERQVMERGRALGFTSDGEALVFLEHTANDSTTGALLHAPLDGSAPRTLERNALRWEALPDGRLVTAAHRVQAGAHNRIDLVDVAANERRPLAVGTSDFILLADASALLAQRVTVDGEDRDQLVLLPIPEHTR